MDHTKQHDYSFNFWIGCRQCSEGCQNCYMFLQQKRRGIDPANVKLCTTTWDKPRRWQRKAANANVLKSVFACSYSDFFLPEADGWRDDAWTLIRDDSESCLAIGEQADAPNCGQAPRRLGQRLSQRLAWHWSGAKEASPSAG